MIYWNLNQTRKAVTAMANRGYSYSEISSRCRLRAEYARTGRALRKLVEIAEFAESCSRDWE